MSNHFSKRWDYTLRIGRFFRDLPDLPSAAEVAMAGTQVAQAITVLVNRVGVDSDLGSELQECEENFEGLDGIENAYEAREVFNQALNSLYDVADAGKRVWVE